MARKEVSVDSRIPTLIRNCIQERKRGFFVVIGDRSKDAIVNLHYIMSTFNPKHNKSVLWAYKDKLLGFTSHRRKRENKIKKEVNRGTREKNSEDPFELFVSLQNIRYVYYKETDKILGNTYGMCILQDFEAITPNILARTIETVEGGGMIVLLLHGMRSLKQIYTLTMDVHARYRTEAYNNVVPRFNERFILSFGSNSQCLVMDDEFNVLPISGGKNVVPLPLEEGEEQKNAAQKEMKDYIEAHRDSAGPLLDLVRTKDQAEALTTFVDVITKKILRCTVALTAARGRGKSAALGVAVAAAISYGYSNIFITSPSPENLKTFFEFVFKGFDALDYQDHADYSIIQSTNPAFNKVVVRVNVFKSQHRQTIQYIRPQDTHVLGQAELLVIDEAAAIPLPLVRKLIGPYLVFLASTVSGYEGTGRSLSLKLIQQMREQSSISGGAGDVVELDRSTGKASGDKSLAFTGGGRSLKEITLSEPIRYAAGDGVEKWLNSLLLLDATLPSKNRISAQGFPPPQECHLLKINRDTLFCSHPVSEKFLGKLVGLMVASHYKNSPDDLQLLSDAPAHDLFVLVPAIEDERLPEPLCVIQVCLEGRINRENVLRHLSRGQRPSGDLIPWLVSQQFQDNEFASLSGCRVVRIATRPEYSSMGYGSRALQLLVDYYEGKFVNLSECAAPFRVQALSRIDDGSDDIQIRDIRLLPPLFAKLTESQPESLDYIGVSYGLTQSLFKFWDRASFKLVYLRQTPNDLTGEFTTVMLRVLKRSTSDEGWLEAFANDFYRRFLELLSFRFRDFAPVLALSLQTSAVSSWPEPSALSKAEVDRIFEPWDLQRLEAYANNLVDYHLILDMTPKLANLFFTGKMKDVQLSSLQQAILLAIGLQRKNVDDVAAELSVQPPQLLAILIKIVRKMTNYLGTVVSKTIVDSMPQPTIGVSRENATGVHDDEVVDTKYVPLQTTLQEDLADGAEEWQKKQRELIDSLPLDQYEIQAEDPAWKEADKVVSQALKSGKSIPSNLSVKTKAPKAKRKMETEEVVGPPGGDHRHDKTKKKFKSHKGA